MTDEAASGEGGGLAPLLWKGRWITVEWLRASESGKTHEWTVSNDGVRLGEVRWYGRWRKYAFYPVNATLYEEVCMRDLATFCETRTREHRRAVERARGGQG